MEDFLQAQSLNEENHKRVKIGKVEFLTSLSNVGSGFAIHLIVTKSAMLDEFDNNIAEYQTKILKHFKNKTGLPWNLTSNDSDTGLKIYVSQYDLLDWIQSKI